MNVEFRVPADLTPHPRNSRLHSAAQVTALGRAIVEFGFTQPVVVDEEGTILAGHARVQAALSIGLAKVPVVVQTGLSEAQKRALVIADNSLHEFGAGWDEDVLGEELRHLMATGFDVTLTGFQVPEPIPEPRVVDEDAVPPVEDVAVSRAGDVWTLAGHRLVVGNACNPTTVAAALAGVAPNLMVTDPPYGVDYDPAWRNEIMRANGTMVAARATGKVLNDDRADWREVWAGFPGDVAYIWHASAYEPVVEASLEAAGFRVEAQIIWDKGRHVIGRGAYHFRHEPCFYALRRKAKGKPRENWHGGRNQSSVWRIPHLRSQTGHGTQKPVEAMRRPILNHTKTGDVVFDPFLGSGTTIIAAHTAARRAVGIELNPLYADVVIRRFEDFTGKPAMLGDKSFAEIGEERNEA